MSNLESLANSTLSTSGRFLDSSGNGTNFSLRSDLIYRDYNPVPVARLDSCNVVRDHYGNSTGLSVDRGPYGSGQVGYGIGY